MRKARMLAYLLNLYSISATAGYECHLKLAHTEDLYKTIAEKTVSITSGQMSAGKLGTLFVESQKGNKIVSLDINGMMSGWRGEQDATFVILRSTQKKRSVKTNTVSEKISIKGSDSVTNWFDNYMLDIKCEVIQEKKED